MKILMYDLARGQSWVSAYWKKVIPALREFGYTHLGLYIEQRYHFASLPAHRPRGGLTPDQAAEALLLCRHHGLELTWFTNTLGHCDGLLANPEFLHLADDPVAPYQLCPSHRQTRPLIRKMLNEFAALSPCELLHIGGDECAMNGDRRCRDRGMTDAELYLDHHQWVIRETKNLGKRPAMWGDMLLKFPEVMAALDKDVLIFDWHYFGGSANTIGLFQQHGFEVVPTTSTDNYNQVFYPFGVTNNYIKPLMDQAREMNCAGMCQSSWEMLHGTYFDNELAQVAAAPALYEARPAQDFAAKFFGSPLADIERLKPLLNSPELLDIHPLFCTNELRSQFFKTGSGYLFYHIYGQKDSRYALEQVYRRVVKARLQVQEIRDTAKRHQEFLRAIDMPLDIFETAYGRIKALARVREATDQIYPHVLPGDEGTLLLEAAALELAQHIEQCERLCGRLQGLCARRGSSQQDVLNLNQQIAELKTLHKYVSYHAGSYAEDVPLPKHELWYL